MKILHSLKSEEVVVEKELKNNHLFNVEEQS